MAWKSISKIKYNGAEFNFMNTPPEWGFMTQPTPTVFVNKFVSLTNNNKSLEEETMYERWLASNPNVFMGGEWAKEHHTKGENEKLFTFPSGCYFEAVCTSTSATEPQIVFRLMRPNGSFLFSATALGINGVDIVNHSLVPNLWVDTRNKKAVIGMARDIGTRMTKSWGGTYENPITNDPWNDAQQTELYNVIYDLLPPDFYDDISTTGGGDGDWYDDSSDTIGLPDLTTLNQNSISNTKFLTCYKMTTAQLNKLGDELWSDNIFTQISNTVLKPTDFIVNLSLLPVDVGGVTKLIKAGKILLNGAEGTLISQQFIRVDCGTLEVKKKWGGAIDYQTDVSIFLPFIGEESLNANEVMGASLNVIYTVDILSGSCIASVRVIKDNLDAVLYQFTGNMASNYPITSADYATVFSGSLQLAVGVGSLPSNGGVLSLVSATSNMLSGADVKRTGSLASSSGFMGIKKPYLILSRPIQSLAESYNHFNGFVSNIKMKLGECSGFTKVDMVHLEDIPCMDEEKAEIESLLKSGVLIN